MSSSTANSPQLFHVACLDAYQPLANQATSAQHRVACWQWGSNAAPHVVVCVHGLTRNARDFDVLAGALVARSAGDVRVVCIDVAGRGASDWLSDPAGYQVPFYVADLLAVLAALQQRAPMQRLSWIGTSMGGLIGMVIAGQPALPMPCPIERLVLNDVGPEIEWAALARIGTYVGQPVHFDTEAQGAAALWDASPTFGPHSSDEWLALSKPMLQPAPQGGWQLHYDPSIAVPLRNLTAESVARGTAGLWQLYDQITARTLLTRGAESDLLSSRVARLMTERGPRARLVEFAGVGHAPTFVPRDQVDCVVSFVLD
ncbi:MAG: alpha/beta hydrolase [Burkholderiales bacterium]